MKADKNASNRKTTSRPRFPDGEFIVAITDVYVSFDEFDGDYSKYYIKGEMTLLLSESGETLPDELSGMQEDLFLYIYDKEGKLAPFADRASDFLEVCELTEKDGFRISDPQALQDAFLGKHPRNSFGQNCIYAVIEVKTTKNKKGKEFINKTVTGLWGKTEPDKVAAADTEYARHFNEDCVPF
jgi:hypothetical protein